MNKIPEEAHGIDHRRRRNLGPDFNVSFLRNPIVLQFNSSLCSLCLCG
jgi:hypothetical protein